jgi:signal transduction histidine kinase
LFNFIKNCPIGLAQVSNQGAFILLNDCGVLTLTPIAVNGRLDNFFDLLRPSSPQLVELLEKPCAPGEVCHDRRIRIEQAGAVIHLTLTVSRYDGESLFMAFKDVTAIMEAERQSREALEAQTIRAVRAEMAATVLHDIGNAITGIHTRSTKLLNEPPWEETATMSRLSAFINSQAGALAPVLGERKMASLAGLASELSRNLTAREISLRQHMNRQARSGSHIEEILSVQRQYARNGASALSEHVSVAELLETALSIQEPGLEERAIHVRRSIPDDLPRLRLDRTRMIQVFGNIIKNASESFDNMEPSADRCLTVTAICDDAGPMVLTFVDNGCGFLPEQASEFFKRGVTSKSRGSGFGLPNCRETIESQGGRMQIQSDGKGKGAKVTVDLPLPMGE